MCTEPEIHDNIETVFNTARQKDDEAQRLAYLDQACAGDLDLRRRVQELLDFDDRAQASDFLTNTPPGLDVPHLSPLSEGPGTLVGRYKLLQELGSGGFGVVYLAEQQEPVRREVALKIIKLGMDTRQVIARFEAERQALALMDHPHIAKVLDASATETGRPYFVMELVEGIPITQYCDGHNLTIKDRLVLFVDVCRAVQHAHQKGIIHRDIKPTNVLVSERDGKPVPKVIDFGIAKATEQRLTEKTLYTDYHQFIGTPQYMSPEQATMMSEQDIDTRTDVYSLGVLLYELLVGSTPFQLGDFREIGYEGICRLIGETEPPTPSRRLSTVGEAATTEVSVHRHVQPAVLSRLLRGDLDWIVMKALEKDRTRRYETANGFASDVQRYLTSEPVEACPPSTAYRFRKFARRNRTVLTMVTLVAMVLIVATVTSTTLAFRESASRRRAEGLRYIADMNQAMQALADNDFSLVRKLLRDHHPSSDSSDGIDRRGWEWYYLWRSCRATMTPTLRHEHIVNSIAVSPNGRTVVSGDADGNLKVWDLSTLRCLDSIRAHDGWGVWNAEFSHDGEMLASTGSENSVRLWRIDPSSGKLTVNDVFGENTPKENWCVTFSPDGKFLAAGGQGKVRMWDLSTRKQTELRRTGGRAFALAFGPGGHALAAHCGTRVVVWELPNDELPEKNLEPICIIEGFKNIAWLDVDFSPDGSLIAATWRDDGVKLWRVEERERHIEIEPTKPLHHLQTGSLAQSLVFDRDGKTLAIGSRDKTISFWDTSTGDKLPNELRGHSSAVSGVRYTPNGTMVSSSLDHTMRIWDLHRPLSSIDQLEPEYPQDYSGRVEALSFSKDGKWIAATDGVWTATAESKVVLWDTKTWQVAGTFSGKGFAFSHDSRLLAVAEFNPNQVQLWDLSHFPYVKAGRIPGSAPLAFSPQDGYLALSGSQNALEVWNLSDIEQPVVYRARSFATFDGPMAMEFSPVEEILAASDSSGDIALLDSRTLEIVDYVEDALEIWGRYVAISPDGRFLVFPDFDHSAKVWEVRDGRLHHARTLGGHTAGTVSATFSSKGLLAIGCARGQVKLWDTTTWQERSTYKWADSPVGALRFSPDGNTLVAGSDNGMIRILRAASPEEVAEAERDGVDPLSTE